MAIIADRSTYLAFAVGNTVVVIDRGGVPAVPTVALTIALAGAAGTGSSITANRDATSLALALGGTPVVGERWLVNLGGVAYGFTVRANLAEVAFGLRDALSVLPGGYTVSLSGATTTITNTSTEFRRDETAPAGDQTLVIRNADSAAIFRAVLTRSSGAAPVASISTLQSAQQQASVVLSGAPLAGEVWTLTLTRTAGGAAVPVVVSHTVDAAAQVATGIAGAITASAQSRFGAAAEVRTLVLVDRSGAAFAAGFTVQVAAPGLGLASNNTVAALGCDCHAVGPGHRRREMGAEPGCRPECARRDCVDFGWLYGARK